MQDFDRSVLSLKPIGPSYKPNRVPWQPGNHSARNLPGLEGQVAVLNAELRDAQAKVMDLTLQCYEKRAHVDQIMAERDEAAAYEVTAVGNLQAGRVACDALSVTLPQKGVEWELGGGGAA